MTLNPRQSALVELVRTQGSATIEALARHFDVTLQTVRRDVNLLSEAGMLSRFHGGVRIESSTIENIAYRKGDLKSGQGTISSQSGALKNQPYGFNTRFADQPGTNPEELLGAAHAGCFSMALSNILGEAGLKADSIETTAEVTLDKTDDGFTITAVHLTVNAVVPGATKDSFADAAAKAKAGCPVSKVLNARISMDATLKG